MHASAGYRVLTDDAPHRHWKGGGAIFYHNAFRFQVRLYQSHGMNVSSSQVAPGSQCRLTVGYIVPDNVATTEDTVADFGQCPCRKVSMMTSGWEVTMTILACSGMGGR